MRISKTQTVMPQAAARRARPGNSRLVAPPRTASTLAPFVHPVRTKWTDNALYAQQVVTRVFWGRFRACSVPLASRAQQQGAQILLCAKPAIPDSTPPRERTHAHCASPAAPTRIKMPPLRAPIAPSAPLPVVARLSAPRASREPRTPISILPRRAPLSSATSCVLQALFAQLWIVAARTRLQMTAFNARLATLARTDCLARCALSRT